MLKLNCSKIAKFVFILLVTPLFVVAYFNSQKAQAQMPSTINFQGKIVRNDSGYEGMNVTTGSPACVQTGADTCDFQIKYYSASSGGTLFLTETFADKEIGQYGGVFELSLGSGSITAGSHATLDSMIQNENTIYIEIGFSPAGNSTFTETFTRMYLQANAFAIRSKYAEMAKGAFKFENAPNSSGYSGSDGMVYYDTTTGGLKLYSAGVWLDITTGNSTSLWGTNSISSYSHNPSQFLETSGIATLSNFGLDTTVNRAWIHGSSSRTGFSVYSNYGGATDWPLVTFKADASSFGNSILQLIQDGTGNILEGYKGSNKVFNFDNRGDMHLSSDGVLYFEPFTSLPTSENLFPESGEGCLYAAGGNIYWDSTCNASAPIMLNAVSSSLWTDAGSFTYLTSTSDNLVLGGNSVATAKFFFDMTGASGRYFRVDNYNNTETLFTIDSSGNVGIGTATPGAKLDIAGSSANITNALGDITISPAQNLIISQGKVGIGNSSPTSLLSVGSSSQFQVDTNGDLVKIKNLTYSWPTAHTTSGLLSNNGSGTLTWNTASDLGLSSGTGVAGQVTFWSGTSTIAGDNNLWWDNVNKRLGIGTTTPQATIDIAGATSEIANTSGNIIISPAENLIVSQGKFAVGTFGAGNLAPASKFHMRWANSGAGGGMDVGGQLMTDAAVFENSGNVFLQLMGGASSEKSINFATPTSASHGAIKYNYTGGGGAVANGFGFWTNGNVFRMALDSNGNLGIGTESPTEKLEAIGSIRGSAVYAKSRGTIGRIGMVGGSATLTGYIEWRLPADEGVSGTRLGYMGWNATNVQLNLENSANFVVSGGNVAVSNLTASRLVYTGTGGLLSAANNGISAANVLASVANTTGTAGNLVFSASPTFTGTVNVSAITASSNGTFNSHLYGRSVSGQYSYLYRWGGLFLTWDSASYGTNTHHSIRSTDGDTWGDSITMNSFGNIRLNIDSNNNGSNYLAVGYNTTGTGNTFFLLREPNTTGFGTGVYTMNLTTNNCYTSSCGVDGFVMTGNGWVRMMAGTMWAGAYSGIAEVQDSGIIFSLSGQNTGGFVIAPHSSSGQGIRIQGSNGNVGIAVRTPTEKLTVSHYVRINHTSSTAWFTFRQYFSAGTYIEVDSPSGYRAISTSASSIKYKKNITDLEIDTSLIYSLRPTSFNWKTDSVGTAKTFGLIAEEVEKYIPELILYRENGEILTVNYDLISVLNLKELQKHESQIKGIQAALASVNSPVGETVGTITGQAGWYRVAKADSDQAFGRIRINNTSLGSSQNSVLEVNRIGNESNVNIISNFISGGNNFSKVRINNVNGVTYLEMYIENTNNNIVKVVPETSSGWSVVSFTYVGSNTTTKEYSLNNILLGVSDNFAVTQDGLTTSGTLYTSGMFSDIGNSGNRWNDIYTKGTIRLGSGSSEGGIRYNVEKKRLEFSNDGINWVEMGDLTSNVVISPEYSGAILYADGSDNHGRMTSDAINTGGVFKNYYEWKSDRETLQDYDILVRITLPSDFVSWKEDAIALDFMTENSASTTNNKVEIALMGDSGIDTETKNGISKMPGAWERISIKAVDITQCKKAGDSCTLRLSMYSKENYYVRVGDISLNYNRGL